MTYSFANSGLIDLDSTDTSLLEVDNLITEGKSKLLGLQLPRNISTGERPVEDGDGSSKHSLHGLGSQTLSIGAPLHGHGVRAANIGDDDRWADVTGAVALYPGILREDKALELLSEVLNHVVALGLSVDQEVKTDLLLEANDGLNLLLDELLILFLSDLTLAKFGTSLTNLLGLL
jgi:hypothetical protein